MIKASGSNRVLRHSLELPCGAILKNRLAKSAMSDSLANGEGNSDRSFSLTRLQGFRAPGGNGNANTSNHHTDPGHWRHILTQQQPAKKSGQWRH